MLLLLWLLCGIVLVVYLVVSGVISFCLLVLVCACYLVRGFGVSWFCFDCVWCCVRVVCFCGLNLLCCFAGIWLGVWCLLCWCLGDV